MTEELNLLGVKCPINYVKTKLKLEQMQSGQELLVLLDDGEAIESVASSVTQDGHNILNKERFDSGWKLTISRS